MGYKVIRHFNDLQDNRHDYQAGDTFPRSGLSVSEERIAELAGSANRLGKPLIVAVEEAKPVSEPEKPKQTSRRKKASSAEE